MNRRLVLNLIRRAGGISRATIAKQVGLSPAVVGYVVGDLLEEGYIREEEPELGGNGRRPVPLVMNDAGHHAVGLKLSAGRLDCMITDLAVRPLARKTVGLDTSDPLAVVQAAADTVEAMLLGLGPARRPLVGAGFSIPARLEVDTGVCLSSLRFGWRDVPIAAMLSKALNLPVSIEDDTLAFGLAHHLFGLGRPHRNFLALAVGEGIGCAAIIDNQVRRGAQGTAGKIGHVLWEGPGADRGTLCECGRRGCLQTVFSVPALNRAWAATHPGTDLSQALAAGENAAKALVGQAGQAMGQMMAQVVTVTDPEIIVLGGEAVAFGADFLDPMQSELNRCYYRDQAPPILPDESSFYWTAGAAAVALRRIFDF